MNASEAYPVNDEAVAPNEMAQSDSVAQSDSEPTPVKLPLPISWRESLRATLCREQGPPRFSKE